MRGSSITWQVPVKGTEWVGCCPLTGRPHWTQALSLCFCLYPGIVLALPPPRGLHSPPVRCRSGAGQRQVVCVPPAWRSMQMPCVHLTVSHCRTLPKSYMEKIVENIRTYNIHALLVVGGFEVRPAGDRAWGGDLRASPSGVLRWPFQKPHVQGGYCQGPRKVVVGSGRFSPSPEASQLRFKLAVQVLEGGGGAGAVLAEGQGAVPHLFPAEGVGRFGAGVLRASLLPMWRPRTAWLSGGF